MKNMGNIDNGHKSDMETNKKMEEISEEKNGSETCPKTQSLDESETEEAKLPDEPHKTEHKVGPDDIGHQGESGDAEHQGEPDHKKPSHETDSLDQAETDESFKNENSTDHHSSKVVVQKPDIAQEILKLIELSMNYPEIGPPLAELAFKADFPHLGERILRMGLQSEIHGVEYHFLAAKLSRREGKFNEALARIVDAIEKCTADPDQNPPSWKSSFLHLVRLGFAILMFDIKDLNANPPFTELLPKGLGKVSDWFKNDPFFLTLKAQAEWFSDKEKSERFWDSAVKADKEETSWNSRGTWYKEAERDPAKAESTYRKGIEAFPKSPLLLHNLAQVIMERAWEEMHEKTPEESYREAHGYLRRALRESHRPRMRRHIHSTMDRLKTLRTSQQTSTTPKEPQLGDVIKGRVRSLKPYGAFVDLGRGQSGLLHKSELAHEWVDDPAAYLKPGDEIQVKIIQIEPRDDANGLRIGLSRKQILNPQESLSSPREPVEAKQKVPQEEKPRSKSSRNNEAKREPQRKPGRSNRRQKRSDNGKNKPMGTLGEILWAQLSNKEKED